MSLDDGLEVFLYLVSSTASGAASHGLLEHEVDSEIQTVGSIEMDFFLCRASGMKKQGLATFDQARAEDGVRQIGGGFVDTLNRVKLGG